MNYGQHSVSQDELHLAQPPHNYSSYYMYQRPPQHLTSLQQQSHIGALHPLVQSLSQVPPQNPNLGLNLNLNQGQNQTQLQPQLQPHPHSHSLLHPQPPPHSMAQSQPQSQPQLQPQLQPHSLSLSQPMLQQLAQYVPLDYFSRVNPSYNYSMYAPQYAPSEPASIQNSHSLPNTSAFASAPSTMASSTMGLGQSSMPQSSSGSSYPPAAGQFQPPGLRPRVTTTMWEDEKTLCYQVDANSVSVVRRADNDMINGTKLLNVARMTRGRRDGILKLEKLRHVVKIGLMHLKGVWIPFDRALQMAQREGIVDLLYPLFVRDIKRVIQTGVTPVAGSAAAAAVAAVAQAPLNGNSGDIPGSQSPSAPSSARHLLSSVSNRHLVSSANAGTMQNLYRLYSLDSQQHSQQQLQHSKHQSLAHPQPQTQPQPQLPAHQPLYGSMTLDQPRPQALPLHYSAQQYYGAPQGMNLYYLHPYQQTAQYPAYSTQPAYSGYSLSQQQHASQLLQSVPHQNQILPMDSQPLQNSHFAQSASTETGPSELALSQHHSFANRNLVLDQIQNPRSHLSPNLPHENHHQQQQQQRPMHAPDNLSSSTSDKPQSAIKLPLGLSEK